MASDWQNTIRQAEEHLIQQDEVLAKIIIGLKPCLLKPKRPFFFTLCSSIISQQLSTKVADIITNRFLALFDGRPPSPEQVLIMPIEDLVSIGLSRAKASYIKDLADKSSQGVIKYRSFNRLPDEEIIQELIAVKGIGRWTAEMFLIFSLNRLDILPVGDLGLQKAIEIHYKLNSLPKKEQILELGERWRPYRSIATWFFWRSLNSNLL